jgi:hypothetical protein
VEVEQELDGGTSAWVERVWRVDGTAAVVKVARPDGLYVLECGRVDVARPFLETAERLARAGQLSGRTDA